MSSSSSPVVAVPHTTNPKKRPAATDTNPLSPPTPKKTLRDFSWLVYQTVRAHVSTTFSQVADELTTQNSDANEANVRRRVYDCLNVLLATGLLARDGRRIVFQGPLAIHECTIRRKRRDVQDQITKLQCWRNLVQRNAMSQEGSSSQHKLPLPFLVLQTDASAVVQCRMSKDLETVLFDISRPFELHDDTAVLQAMGLHKTDVESLRSWLPAEIVDYSLHHGMLDHMLVEK